MISLPSPPARRAGFTLIELVVVLLILGVILGIAGPAFVLRGAAAGDDASAPVAGVLARARRTAIESARVTTVTIDPRSARVWVRTEGAEPNVDTTFTLALSRDSELQAPLARVHFTFDARGGASGEPLTVTSPGGRATISLDRASGEVRIGSVSAGPNDHAPR